MFAIGCAVGAIANRNDRPMLIFLLACMLLNGAAAGHMIWTAYGHTWRLLPSEEITEPVYRR